jgi:NADPH:quinone reductase-like Zn-dependent oxidoreductase
VGAVITTRLGSRPATAYLADVRRDDLVTLKELIEAGNLRPVIDRTIRFEEIPEGIRYVESGAAGGKVVVTL